MGLRRHHRTRNTVQEAVYCKKCGENTIHAVSYGRLGACLRCLNRQEQEARARRAEPPPRRQGELF